MVDKIEEVKKLVKGVVDKYKIFEGMFESVTYYWGGDYEGKTFEEKNRQIVYTRVSENEIVGKLRWFLRTVLARFVANNLDNYKEVDDCLYFLGKTSGEALKSDYIFRVEVTNPGEEVKDVDLKALERVKLTRKSDKRFLPIDNVKFNLEVYRLKWSKRKEDEKCVSVVRRDFLVVGGTLLTLAYLGIGKAANRGFGRFYATKVLYKKDEEIANLNDKILKGDIVGAFDMYYETLGFDKSKGNDWRKSKIPLAPLTSGTIENGKIYVNERMTDKFTSISCCNKVVLKSTWKTYWNGNIRDPGLKIHTWLFGLPRTSKIRSKVTDREYITGYITSKEKRRVSPIVLSPIRLTNGSYKIAVLPFLSSLDFEELLREGLEHVGVHNFNSENEEVHKVNVADIVENRIELQGNEMNAPPREMIFVTGTVASLIENYIRELPNVLSKICKSSLSKPSTADMQSGTKGRRRY